MEETLQKFRNLCNWITQNGGYVNPKLTIQQTEKFGRSIVTTSDLAVDEELFRLPKSLHLNPTTVGITQFDLDNNFEFRDQVVIALLRECQNPNTKWRPYVELLPQLVEFSNHPMVMFYQNKFPNFSADIFNRVQGLYQSFNQFYTKLQSFQSQTGIFTQMPNFNECMWAFLAVITRMWAGAGLVPFADMLQHSNQSQIYLDTKEEASSMSSKQVLVAGSTVFDNYLVQDDITLYVNFGFVESSPITHLSVGFQFETKNTVVADIINSQRRKFENKKIFISTEGLHNELLSFLRFHVLDANDLKIGNFENDNFCFGLITLANELRALQKLKFRISHLLDKTELEYVERNFSGFAENSTEWQICKLVLNTQEVKNKVDEFIYEYWKSFI